ncbi:MAG: radical SAM protein, partial [candidate division WOR-3 bacterium]|nr:radical SAM protein [candidate division WOR-3 bacterium]
VADPYQPIEEKYCLTRQAIRILKAGKLPFEILTKSSLITRDIDLIKDYDNCSVELTITTIDDNVRKIFEPNADTIENRLMCLERLISAGIETSVFFGPVLPYFSDRDEVINKIFDTLASIGVKRILVDKLNYQNKKVPIIIERLKHLYPQAISYYQDLIKNPNGYDFRLRQRIIKIAQHKQLSVTVLF